MAKQNHSKIRKPRDIFAGNPGWHRRKWLWKWPVFFFLDFMDFMGINNLIAMNISRLLLVFLFPGIHQIDIGSKKQTTSVLVFFWDFAKIPSSNLTCLYFLSDISDMASLHSILYTNFTLIFSGDVLMFSTWRTWPSMWSFQNHWSQSLRSGVRACAVANRNHRSSNPQNGRRSITISEIQIYWDMYLHSTWYDVI